MQQCDHKRTKAKDDFESFQAETASAQKRSLQLQNQRLQKVEALAALELSVRQLEEGKNNLRGKLFQLSFALLKFLRYFVLNTLAEIGTPLQSELSKTEEKELNTLNTELNELRNSIIGLTDARSKIQTEKSLIELTLSENLLVREEELEKHVTVIEFGEDGVELDQSKAELSTIETRLTTAISESNRVNTQLAEVSSNTDKIKSKIEELKDVCYNH